MTSPEREPEKEVAEEAVVAEEAFPLSEAVIVPAEKLPEASRATMALGVAEAVAVVAEFATFPAEETVWSLESGIVLEAMSLPTTWELDRTPEASE